jgi:hypothetical protein
MNGPVFHPVDEATKARYEMLGQDLYAKLDVTRINPSKNQYQEAEANLIMSMLQDGYDPSQLTLEEERILVQYFDLRLLRDLKNDVLQDRKDNSKVPLDTATKKGDLAKAEGHSEGGS